VILYVRKRSPRSRSKEAEDRANQRTGSLLAVWNEQRGTRTPRYSNLDSAGGQAV
jgi:hypothetical protein